MKTKFRLDPAAIKAAMRTAGALMFGNGIVGPLLLGNRDWVNIALLIFAGLLVIIVTSIEQKR